MKRTSSKARMGILLLLLTACSPEGGGPAPSQPVPTIDHSPELQAKRSTMIAKLRKAGIWGDVTCSGDYGTVKIRPGFYALDFDDKKTFISVVYAYCLDGSNPYAGVSLIDIKTGNEVGVFNGITGLKLKE
jgi:hypothetical protein